MDIFSSQVKNRLFISYNSHVKYGYDWTIE